jgi:hypothetical protein
MVNFWTREQCEEFNMMRFGITCATCELSDDECPWHRRDTQTRGAATEQMSEEAA